MTLMNRNTYIYTHIGTLGHACMSMHTHTNYACILINKCAKWNLNIIRNGISHYIYNLSFWRVHFFLWISLFKPFLGKFQLQALLEPQATFPQRFCEKIHMENQWMFGLVVSECILLSHCLNEASFFIFVSNQLILCDTSGRSHNKQYFV